MDSNTLIQISPTYLRLRLSPGETESGTFVISNAGPETLSYKIYSMPYVPEGKNSETLLADWISIYSGAELLSESSNYSLESATEQTLSYIITVPTDASNDQSACIFVETNQENSTQSPIRTVARTGLILYAEISELSVQSRSGFNLPSIHILSCSVITLAILIIISILHHRSRA